MEKTEAGLKGLCIREIMTEYTLYQSSYYQLKQLRPVARSLSVEAAKTLVQAFVSSRLDYCNAILHSLPEKLMRRLHCSRCRTLPRG